MSGAGIVAKGDGKPRLFVLVLLFALLTLALVPAYAAAECMVHGSVYDWSTFGAVNNAIVDVYSMPSGPGASPVNHYVARTGSYSFILPEGSYMLVAIVGRAGRDRRHRKPHRDGQRRTHHRPDPVPRGSLDDLGGFAENTVTPTLPPVASPTLVPNPTGQPARDNWTLWLSLGTIVLAILAIGAGLLLLKALRPKKTEEPPAVAENRAKTEVPLPAREPVVPPVEPEQATEPSQPVPPAQAAPPQPTVQDLLLPEDCRQVLAILEKHDGRITQLDLRKALPYSEAKVSLIVSDLASRRPGQKDQERPGQRAYPEPARRSAPGKISIGHRGREGHKGYKGYNFFHNIFPYFYDLIDEKCHPLIQAYG
jgi:uncharacterized membrane protein